MIRNLKIFFNVKNNKRKFKLQLTTLALSIALTGCSFNENHIQFNEEKFVV